MRWLWGCLEFFDVIYCFDRNDGVLKIMMLELLLLLLFG